MATLVLVHGAMHGGWAWSPVRRLLTARGHEVHTPTLTGQGDRAHLLTRETGVATHVADLVALLDFEDLRGAVLVLHSYAGVLVGPVVAARPDRVSAVVLAGGFHTRPGMSLLDAEPPEVAARYRDLVERTGEGWYLPATDAFLAQWAVTDPALQAFVAPRLTDFPARALADPVVYDPAPLAAVPRTYVEHVAPPLASLAPSIALAREDGFVHRTIATGHDMMLADPPLTAGLLEELAG